MTNARYGCEYHFGSPSLDEWNGLWKSHPTDSDVSEQEFERCWCWRRFYRYLARLGRTAHGPNQEFYFRGDNYGVRTQYLELATPAVLNVEFVLKLQDLLKRPVNKQWRILIPTYVSDAAAVLVYRSVVRVGKTYGDDLKGALERIVGEMDRQRTNIRLWRILEGDTSRGTVIAHGD